MEIWIISATKSRKYMASYQKTISNIHRYVAMAFLAKIPYLAAYNA